jgi:glycosyltransferase involved in cell wall biosynthesis
VKYVGKRLLRPVIDRYLIPRYNAAIFSRPERVVVHSGFHADLVRRFAPGAHVTVSPLPVPDMTRIEGPANAEPIHPFAEGDRVMTILGFVESRKDYIGVLRALTLLPARFKLLVAGGCPFAREAESPASTYGKMMRFAKENGLRDRVHVTGFFPDSALPRIVAATNVFLVPFLVNHCSASITTGAASSLPVIAYRTMLTGEMNRNGAGIIEVSGWEEIPGIVLAAEKDPSVYGESVGMGERYREKHSYHATAVRFVELYRELLA